MYDRREDEFFFFFLERVWFDHQRGDSRTRRLLTKTVKSKESEVSAEFIFWFEKLTFAISKQRLTLAGQEIAALSWYVPERPFSVTKVLKDILNIYKLRAVNHKWSLQRTSSACFKENFPHWYCFTVQSVMALEFNPTMLCSWDDTYK